MLLVSLQKKKTEVDFPLKKLDDKSPIALFNGQG